MLAHSSLMKSRKRLVCDIFATFATYTGLTYDVTDRDCWGQMAAIIAVFP